MKNAKALAHYTALTGAALGLAADEVGEIGSSRLVHRSSLHGMAWHDMTCPMPPRVMILHCMILHWQSRRRASGTTAV